ncbi:MAG: MerR family transcriptional regulator [Chitinophagaceae bacterium]|nr:MerR family transcriptional regulator [Chitinophagaceae bacterium]
MDSKQITFDFEMDPAPENNPQAGEVKAELKESLIKKKKGGRRSLKEAAEKEVVLPPDEELFKKSYYTIGKVAEMFGENTSLIRFWENEFQILKPRKNRKGDRYFRPEDIKMLWLIHDLLRKRKFTIDGAREYLKNETAAVQKMEIADSLEKLKLFLLQLKHNL